MTKKPVSEARSRFRFLKPDELGEMLARERELDHLVTLPDFVPVKGAEPLEDGEAPTKLGQRFRAAFAENNDVSEDDVPHGLIRDIEALSADHDRNIQAFASPIVLRNHAGAQTVVRFRAHTALVGPFIANGRQLTRISGEIRGKTTLITSGTQHSRFLLPEIQLASPDQPRLLAIAQTKVDTLPAYSGEDRDFIDSIGLEGVLSEPVVVPFSMVDRKAKCSAFVPQTDDGWRRMTAAQTIMSEILGVDATMTYRHWENEDGTLTVRSHDAESIRRTLSALRFSASDRAKLLYPTGSTSSSVQNWLKKVAEVNPEVRAFQRVRTTWIYLVIAAKPIEGKNAYDVCYQDMAARHIPALAPRPWTPAATDGLVAIRAVDGLVRRGLANDRERAVFLGETQVPWSGGSARTAFPNRVVATVEFLARLTTDGGRGQIECSGDALREHGMRNHPDERSRIAAAQATVVAGIAEVKNGAYGGQVTAALAALFKHAALWKDPRFAGTTWTSLIALEPDELRERAQKELSTPGKFKGEDEQVGALGPAQRALMALAGTAHAINPALMAADHSLTRTGRGGRGAVTKADPPALLMRMVKTVDGIEQCAAILEATIKATPAVPIDPIDDKPMTEEWLRGKYLSIEDGPDDGPKDLDPVQRWWVDLESLKQRLVDTQRMANNMREMAVPDQLSGAAGEGKDNAPKMLERLGVQPEQAAAMKRMLEDIRSFADEGAVFFKLNQRGAA